jgi:proline racemase
VIESLKTLEYHVCGQPVRVIVGGVPSPEGETPGAKAAWFVKHADRYRRALVLPPRGHIDMAAVLLTEATSPDAHAGMVFLDADGAPPLLVPAVMAAATAAVDRGLLFARDADAAGGRFVFDTPAGQVAVRLAPAGLTIEMVPAFVHTPAFPVALGSRTVPADVAFGGAFYAIVDGEAAQVPLDVDHVPELRRLARAICAAVTRSAVIAHPLLPAIAGLAGVVFTAPAHDGEAHLRSVVVSRGGVVDWSPGGGGISAVLAVLDAMGLVADGQAMVHEGLNGSTLRARVLSRTSVAEIPALTVAIEGRAWATGEQTWLVDHDDPFRHGGAEAPRRSR